MSAKNCLLCGQPFDANLSQTGDRQLCVKCERHESAPTALGAHALQPNVLVASIAGIASAAIFYAVGPLLLLQNTAINHLFCGHGWIPYACVLLFFVAVWAMLLKVPLLRREASAFGLHLLPEEAGARLGFVELNKTLDRIARLSRRQRSLLVVTRVRQAVLRLNQLGTAEKLDDLLRYRAETDEASLESSYAAPKFIIWAIPVLGFVGTVLGISNGVQAFSTLIQNASDIDGLRDSLKGVTYGLGQAFETTMIALCMSMVLMLMLSWLQRREDRLLSAIDDYCMEHLLYKVALPSKNSDSVASDALLAKLDNVVELMQKVAHQMSDSTNVKRASSPASPRNRDGMPSEFVS